MTPAVDVTKPFIASDGWEYASLADRVLDRPISPLLSAHNRAKVRAPVESIWSDALFIAAKRPSYFNTLKKGAAV